jgi:cell division protein FtsQ
VRTTKRFPGEVFIAVKEYPVVALELTETGDIAGLLSNGTAIPYGNVENAASRPILGGWKDDTLKVQLTRTLASIAPELLQDISEIRPSATEPYPDRIVLYTRSQYEVITRISYLADKISLLDDYVYDMKMDNRTTGRIILLETDYAQSFDQEPAGADAE